VRSPPHLLTIDVAVIGAGIIGSAIAAALAEAGLRTALIDAGSAGQQGASQYSGGLTRIYDNDAAIAALVAHRHDDTTSVVGRTMAATRRKTGLLYLGLDPDDAWLQRCVATLSRPDYPIEMLDAEAVGRLTGFPANALHRHGLYEPQATIGNLRAGASQLAHYVKTEGVLIESLAVTALNEEADGVRLTTAAGEIKARIVVLAAGGFTRRLLGQLPLVTRSIPLVRTMASRSLPLPIIDVDAGTYVVPLADRMVHIGSNVREEAGDPSQLAWQANDDVRADGLRRLGLITGADEPGPVIDHLPGLDGYTPDGRPLIGFLDGHAHCFVATGYCGIGYKLAAPTAALATEAIVARLTEGDAPEAAVLLPFSPQRFQRGDLTR